MVSNELLRVGQLAADIAPNEKSVPFSAEAWLYALEMTLLGMGMIFAVLGVLWGVLAIFKLVFARPQKKSKEEVAQKQEQTVAATTEPAPVVSANDDAELVAILTAAIVAYESENNPNAAPANFRVVSYRRTNGGRSWNSK